MSNSTQNEDRCVSHGRIGCGNLHPLDCSTCARLLKDSTQNDWEKQLSSLIDDTIENRHDYKGSLVVEDDILFERLNENLKPFVAELLADARKEGHELGRSESVEFEVDKARKEVIERIEFIFEKDVRSEITVWLESKEYCLGYNEALKDVLATLREEEQHG